jgi:cold shock CspA family protein
MTSDANVISPSSERLIGRVKWFNTKAGYGFITATNVASGTTTDVFVHHSAVDVENQQYKYLVQGEYVEYSLIHNTASNGHEFQASKVNGINGGKLMCETRHDFKLARNTYKSDFEQKEVPIIRSRGEGPRGVGTSQRKPYNNSKNTHKNVSNPLNN